MNNFFRTKFVKYLRIITINLLLFVCLWFLLDLFFYSYSLKQASILNVTNLLRMYKTDLIYYQDSDDYFSGNEDNTEHKGRSPDGLEYKNAEPIVIFGCSFAFGHHLKASQTFSRKLSQQLKRPVYNRAFCGAGFQHALQQSLSYNFYKTVPPSKTVIYVLIEDHFQRMAGETFFLYDHYLNLHYKYKNGKFIIDNYNNLLLKFLKTSYFRRYISKSLNYHYYNNPKYNEQITDEALAYLIKTRDNLENHWNKNVNFVVFSYLPSDKSELLIRKLKKNGFKVVSEKDLTNEDLMDKKYQVSGDSHPNEKVWTLLTPLFIKKLKSMNVL